MKEYTLGFIFNSTLENVLLIHKSKPEWQNGKLNGIGGKVELGESVIDCIIRETQEETGLETNTEQWVKLGMLQFSECVVTVFALQWTGLIEDAQSMEIEKIEWFNLSVLPSNCISNLFWLIPLALDQMKFKEFTEFNVYYN